MEIDIQQDPTTLTLTVTTRLDATIERAWQLWADPRQLERWWGPPTYPATVLEHDLVPDGRVSYVMTGPEGEKHGGWWRILSVDAPRSLELEDGFADASGEPNPDLPVTRMRTTLEADGDGTVMRTVSTFPSLEAMQQLVGMGMVDGLREAMSQIPAVLAA